MAAFSKNYASRLTDDRRLIVVSEKPSGVRCGVNAIMNCALEKENEERQRNDGNGGKERSGAAKSPHSRKDSPASKLADTYRKIRGMLDDT
eukprot:scaffold1282_cov251-Pinguiococcus_pyrenoidosus.AAC.30